MKEIIVAYWYGNLEDKVGIKRNTIYEHSVEKRHEIVDLVLSKGLNIMLFQTKERLIIWIDDKKFQQR